MFRLIFLLIFLQAFLASPSETQKPIPIIFDSDMGPDYDDVGAIALLHAFADSGKIKILATIASTRYEGVAAVFNVFNTYFKRPAIPIGVPKSKGIVQKDWQHWTDTLIANYPHKIKNNQEVPEAVDVYRKLLASQPDHSVTIVTTGFMTNLATLLQSKPDKYSTLPGAELVDRKVKLLVCMAGKFPSGSEFNLRMDSSASQYVFKNWTTPVLFSGFEIGWKIRTGLPLINNKKIRSSPVKDVFRICIPLAKEDSAGRMSWDETAVLVAVNGTRPFYSLQPGHIEIAPNGSNSWKNGVGIQAYLLEAEPAEKVQMLINRLIMHQPLKK